MSRFDAIGFGGLNVDRLFKVAKIAKAGEESHIIDCEEACGGSAANTIVGLARLGCGVGFVGKVAEDREGRMLVEAFRKEGVDTDGVICVKDGRSGVVMGFVDKSGERALYVDAGVNDTLDFREIDVKYASQTRFLHLTSFVGEKSFQTQKRLVEALPQTVRVSIDPGELYASKGSVLESMMRKAYAIMPNLRELELLTGTTDFREGANALLKKGVEIVAVKLGSKGCYVTDGKERHQIDAFKVNVVDTTGAGDAFCAGFLYGLISGKNLSECGRLGNFVAFRCIMRMGARTGLPYLNDLEFGR